MRIWNRNSKQPIHEFKCGATLLGIRYFHEGQLLAGLTNDGTLTIWDTRDDWPEWKQIQLPGATSLAAVNGSKWLAVAGMNKVDLVNGTNQDYSSVELHTQNKIVQIAMSSDGCNLVASAEESGICLWNLSQAIQSHGSTKPSMIMSGHTEPATGLCFSEDSSRLYTASPDRSLKLWDLESGQPLLSLPANFIGIPLVTFIPEKQRIVLICNSAVVQWSAHTKSGENVPDWSDSQYREKWFRNQLTRANQLGHQHAVIFQGSQFIRNANQNDSSNDRELASLLNQRAYASAKLGQWSEALDDVKAIPRPTDFQIFLCVLLAKKIGDTEIFNQMLKRMLERANTKSIESLNSILWAYAFAEGNPPHQLDSLLQKLASAKANAAYLSTLAAIQYRKGNFNEAEEILRRCQKLRSGKLYPSEEFFLAMTLQRLDRQEESRQIINSTLLWLDQQRQLYKRRQPTDSRFTWHDDLESQLLFSECQSWYATD